jgi:DNA-binding MarR family transcriptional regulator
MRKQPDLAALDPLIHVPARLGIVSLLMTGAEVDFTLLRDRLGLTDGNVNAHLRKLEEAGYLKATKGLLGRRTRTTYRLLPRGRAAFARHLAALERLLRPAVETPAGRGRGRAGRGSRIRSPRPHGASPGRPRLHPAPRRPSARAHPRRRSWNSASTRSSAARVG